MRQPDKRETRFKKLRKKTRSLRPRAQKDAMRTDFTSHGLRSQTEALYVGYNPAWTKKHGKKVIISLAAAQDPDAVERRFSSVGYMLPYPDMHKAIVQQACEVRNFKRVTLLERPGYDAHRFVFANGKYTEVREHGAGRTADELEVAFQTDHRRGMRRGSRRQYHNGLAGLLKGQDVLIFALVAPLAAHVLRFSGLGGSFGIQLVGPEGSGKTTALSLAASTVGQPRIDYEIKEASIFQYVGLGEKTLQHNDHPMIITGADQWFALESSRDKLEMVRKFERLFRGTIDVDAGGDQSEINLIVLCESRKSLEELCGDEQGARDRLAGRLLTVPIPADRPGKVVASLPDGIESSGELIHQLQSLIAQHYGHAGRRLAKRILRNSVADEYRLRAGIRRLMNRFVAQTGVDVNNGRELQAAFRFGLIYAAAHIAKWCGAIHPDLDAGRAVLACFQLYQNSRRDRSLANRLEALLAGPNVVDLGAEKNLPKVEEERLKSALLFVRKGKSKLQVYIRKEDICRVLPDWPKIEQTDECESMLEYEKEKRSTGATHRHRTVKRSLGAGLDQERVLCFNLPLPDTSNR